MKRVYFIILIVLAIILVLFIIDKKVWMKERIFRHELWEHYSGDRIRGDFILIPDNVSFRKDTMILDYTKNGINHVDVHKPANDTLILKYQYFDVMKVVDPKTGEVGKYSMKGASWLNYLFK